MEIMQLIIAFVVLQASSHLLWLYTARYVLDLLKSPKRSNSIVHMSSELSLVYSKVCCVSSNHHEWRKQTMWLNNQVEEAVREKRKYLTSCGRQEAVRLHTGIRNAVALRDLCSSTPSSGVPHTLGLLCLLRKEKLRLRFETKNLKLSQSSATLGICSL